MAGIAGIIFKQKVSDSESYIKAFDRMLDKLAFSPSQLKNLFTDNGCLFGNVAAHIS